MKKNSFLYLFLSFVILLSSCQEETPAPQNTEADNTALALGNPSNASQDASQNNNYLLVKEEYTLSYNQSKATANWVAWHLDNSWIGEAERQDDFRPDETLPENWYRVITSDYTNSGFDRGHLCPSADRTRSITANSNTFLMTNIVPQAPRNNRSVWASLESDCRASLEKGNELYIYAGVEGKGGTGSNGAATKVDNQITVPAYLWKVIVILPEGNGDISRIDENTRIITVKIPNNQDVESDWGIYRISLDDLESSLGYDFLSTVPENVQNVIESRVDDGSTDF